MIEQRVYSNQHSQLTSTHCAKGMGSRIYQRDSVERRTSNHLYTGSMALLHHPLELVPITMFRRDFVRDCLIVGPPLGSLYVLCRWVHWTNKVKIDEEFDMKRRYEGHIFTLYKAVPSGTYELGTFLADAVPIPLKHLNDDFFLYMRVGRRSGGDIEYKGDGYKREEKVPVHGGRGREGKAGREGGSEEGELMIGNIWLSSRA